MEFRAGHRLRCVPTWGSSAVVVLLLLVASLALDAAGATRASAAAAPAVTALGPRSGPTAGGTLVTITGSAFTGATRVTFGGTAATGLQVMSDTRIQVRTPARPVGTVAVRVSTRSGTSPLATAARFTYASAPAVTAVSPGGGLPAGGTLVTLTGSGFTGTTRVTFGGTAATGLQVLSATQIRVRAPARPVGTVDVRVSTAIGTSLVRATARYTYGPLPAVTSVGPVSGPSGGGTLVTITGTGFGGATRVTVGTAVATALQVLSTTRLQVRTPPGVAGTVPVRVTTAAGTSPLHGAARFTYGSRPSVTGIEPVSGPPVGGTVVTLTGTSLAGATGASFGTVAAGAIEVVSPTEVRVTTPPSAAGAVDVRVTTPMGTSAPVAAARFAFVEPACVPDVVHVSGEILADTTWAPDCASVYVLHGGVTVAGGVTLTISPGTVVKSGPGGYLSASGEVVVAGTADRPVTFTAEADDSVAGDTNGDGPTSSPTAWQGLRAPGGTLRVAHAVLRYGGITADSGATLVVESSRVTGAQIAGLAGTTVIRSTTVEDTPGHRSLSTWGSGVGIVVQHHEDGGAPPVVSGNAVHGAASIAYLVVGDELRAQDLTGNTAAGNGADALGVAGRLTGDWRIEDGDLPLALVGFGERWRGVEVTAGASLTLGPGQVVKSYTTGWCRGCSDLGRESGLTVAAGASFTAAGTAEAPVVLTSSRDDSVGRPANLDGDEAVANIWHGISVGGTADLRHAVVRYAGVNAYDAASLRVVDSRVTDGGITSSGAATVITGTTVESTPGSAQLSHHGSGVGIRVTAPSTSAPPAILRDNVVTGAASLAYLVAGNALAEADLSGNRATGNGADVLGVAGTLAGTWDVGDGDLGLGLVSYSEHWRDVSVGTGASVTIGAGQEVRAYTTGWCRGCSDLGRESGLRVAAGGSLTVAGSAGRPVLMTSGQDPSGAGSLDGTPASGGTWGGIQPERGGVTLTHTVIRHAFTAVSSYGDLAGSPIVMDSVTIEKSRRGLDVVSGALVFRGRVSDVPQAVVACTWHSRACSVDATYVDWDRPEGPDQAAATPQVCGAVTYDKWQGSTAESPATAFAPNCDGSATPDQQVRAGADSYHARVAAVQIDCSGGYAQACELLQRSFECLDALRSAAIAGSTFPLPDPVSGDASAYATTAVQGFVDYKAAQAQPFPSGFGAASFALKIVGAVGSMAALHSAYGACAP